MADLWDRVGGKSGREDLRRIPIFDLLLNVLLLQQGVIGNQNTAIGFLEERQKDGSGKPNPLTGQERAEFVRLRNALNSVTDNGTRALVVLGILAILSVHERRSGAEFDNGDKVRAAIVTLFANNGVTY